MLLLKKLIICHLELLSFAEILCSSLDLLQRKQHLLTLEQELYSTSVAVSKVLHLNIIILQLLLLEPKHLMVILEQ